MDVDAFAFFLFAAIIATQPDRPAAPHSAPKSTGGALRRDPNAPWRVRVSEDSVLNAPDSVVHASQGERRKCRFA